MKPNLLDSFVEYYCPICSLNFKIWNSIHYVLRPLKKITVERNKTIFPVYRCLHCCLYYELIDQKPKSLRPLNVPPTTTKKNNENI